MAAQSAEVMRLRTQIGQMQRRTAHADALSVPEALAPLFPSGGLRPGAAYALADSPSLLFALAGRSSREGSWCAFIGMPDLSLEAAEGYGVAPGRVALIPAPGERWLQAVLVGRGGVPPRRGAPAAGGVLRRGRAARSPPAR